MKRKALGKGLRSLIPEAPPPAAVAPAAAFARDGAFADLVVFDPATVMDRSTYEDPRQYPAGIDWVLVNGCVVVENGKHSGERPGRTIRSR